MPCLLGLIALGFPRLVVLAVFFFSDYISRAVGDKVLLPVLAFLFMPLTLLAYCFAINSSPSHKLEGVYWIVVIVAAMVDLGMLGGGAKKSRKRKVVYVEKRPT